MPILNSAIGAAATLGGSLINAGAQKRINRESQAWNEKMFNLQDERDLRNWNMTNEYNSPQAQMKRLQEAGLNPNLVYGNGSAVSTASEPHASAPNSWNPKAPEINLGSPVAEFFNLEMKTAQTDNLKAQNTVLLEEAMLKKAQTRATLANAGLSEFNLNFKSELKDTSADALRENLRGAQIANTNRSVEGFYLSALRQSQLDNLDLDKMVKEAQIQNLNVSRDQMLNTIKSIKADVKLKELEADLQKNGISKNDPIYFRIIARYLADKFTLK